MTDVSSLPAGFNPAIPAVEWKARVALEAMKFFGVSEHAEALEILGLPPSPEKFVPLCGSKFVDYLSRAGWGDQWPNASEIQYILNRLTKVGLLSNMGAGPEFLPLLRDCYVKLGRVLPDQAPGHFWLSLILGSEFLIPTIGSITIPIGVHNADGAVHIGSGLLLDETTILTCRHVFDGWEVDDYLPDPLDHAPLHPHANQEGRIRTSRVVPHETEDVALVKVDLSESFAKPLPGMAFRDPARSDRITLFGYPPVPYATSAPLITQMGEVASSPIWVNRPLGSAPPAMVAQQGEVVSSPIETLDRVNVFLFSAVARPGNSGGPVVASDGRVIGMVTRELEAEVQGPWKMPFFAGLPAGRVVAALKDLGFDTSNGTA
jgi:hypothetical protein